MRKWRIRVYPRLFFARPHFILCQVREGQRDKIHSSHPTIDSAMRMVEAEEWFDKKVAGKKNG